MRWIKCALPKHIVDPFKIRSRRRCYDWAELREARTHIAEESSRI